MPKGVYPRSPLFGQQIRLRAQRRRALGLPSYNPKLSFEWSTVPCEGCAQPFRVKIYGEPARGGRRRKVKRFCSPRCVCKFMWEKKRKVADDAALLRRLYWNDRLTSTEIAELFSATTGAVIHQLTRLGIPRRVSRCAPHCLVGGCTRPRFRGRGSRCRQHWIEYREAFQTAAAPRAAAS
jgi:hypothetical protein